MNQSKRELKAFDRFNNGFGFPAVIGNLGWAKI